MRLQSGYAQSREGFSDRTAGFLYPGLGNWEKTLVPRASCPLLILSSDTEVKSGQDARAPRIFSQLLAPWATLCRSSGPSGAEPPPPKAKEECSNRETPSVWQNATLFRFFEPGALFCHPKLLIPRMKRKCLICLVCLHCLILGC